MVPSDVLTDAVPVAGAVLIETVMPVPLMGCPLQVSFASTVMVVEVPAVIVLLSGLAWSTAH